LTVAGIVTLGATAFAFVAGVLCPVFESPVRRAAEAWKNLVAYRDRLIDRYYGDAGARIAA